MMCLCSSLKLCSVSTHGPYIRHACSEHYGRYLTRSDIPQNCFNIDAHITSMGQIEAVFVLTVQSFTP